MPTLVEGPFRSSVEATNGVETAVCGLLQQIVGVADREAARVGRDACTACCTAFRPSLHNINSVIASFLFQMTGGIIEHGSVAGCNVEKATHLHQWAKTRLEFVVPAEQQFESAEHTACECVYLGSPIGHRFEGDVNGHVRTVVYECRHANHSETTESECRFCRDWATESGRPSKPLEALLEGTQSGQPPSRWAVGITATAREESTIDHCLDSLRRAGWGLPRLFIDGTLNSNNAACDLPVTLRVPAVGAWPNYYLSLMELLLREPDADAFMIVQDDAVFYDRENLRQYLETTLWPSDGDVIVSLYCSSAYTPEKTGWQRHGGQWDWGALAFVFPRDLALRFISDPKVLEHRWTKGGDRYIDDVISQWAGRSNVAIHFPSPSLVQHIGKTSTLWPGVPAAGYRRSDFFAGDV